MSAASPTGLVPPPARLAWTVWGLGAALYLYGFFQRVAPGVMGEDLARDFALSGAALGNLSAFYFYSYVAMQVPTGLLADAWGPRRLLSLGGLLAAAGSFLFAAAPTAALAGAGRLLIGGSVAVAFVGMLKIASHWLPARRYALASGMALFTGICGAVFAGVPLQLAVGAVGWRWVMVGGGVVILAVAAAIWLVVRDDPSERGYASYAHGPDPESPPEGIWAGLRRVTRYRNTLLLAIVPGGIVGSLLTFSGLWGVPYLTTHYQLSPTQAAAMTSALLIAWALGGPAYGHLSDRLGRRKWPYAVGVWACLGGWLLLLFLPPLPLAALTLLLVLIGLFSGSMIISFVFAKESVPLRLAGTVSGVVNMGVMAGPMVLQPAVGWVLDALWNGAERQGVRVYDLFAYRSGFALMLAWLGLAAVLILLARESYGQQAR